MIYNDDMNSRYFADIEARPRDMGVTLITRDTMEPDAPVVDVRLSIEQTKQLIHQLNQIVIKYLESKEN